jgi:RNA polymerase sigma factor (sigma-70 family)
LVQRFAREHDGEAFSMIVGRYGDMVYTTCYRILREEARASDAVQETFLQLARSAARIQGSVGGWLHRVATRRAVDLVRQEVSRRQREHRYALDAETGASTWSEVESAVDAALEELPEDLREVLVLHFLQGRSTVQIAAVQQLSQPTISRRINEALELMRETLRGQGIQVAVAPLQTLLLHSNRLVPQAVRAGLGKIALAKAVVAHTSAAAPGAVGSALAVKAAAVAAAVTVAAGAGWVAHRELRESPSPLPAAPAVARQEPGPAPPWGSPGQPGSQTAQAPPIFLPGQPPTAPAKPALARSLARTAKPIPGAKRAQVSPLAAKKPAPAQTNASPAPSALLAGSAPAGAWWYQTEGNRQATTNRHPAAASQEALLLQPLSRSPDIPWLTSPGTNRLRDARHPWETPWENPPGATNVNLNGPAALNPYGAAALPSSLPPVWYPMRMSPPALPARAGAPNRPKAPPQ